MQFVEGVKELFLRPLLVAQQLDIVDQQNIGFAIALVELLHALRADAGDHLIHEALAGRVDDPHGAELVHQFAADGVHQMGLPHPHAAVDEQRIVAARGVGGHRPRGGVRKLVAGPHHKGIEREFRIQIQGWTPTRRPQPPPAPGSWRRVSAVLHSRHVQWAARAPESPPRTRAAYSFSSHVRVSRSGTETKRVVFFRANVYSALQPVVIAFGADLLLQIIADLIPGIHQLLHTTSTQFPQGFPQQRGISRYSIQKNCQRGSLQPRRSRQSVCFGQSRSSLPQRQSFPTNL